MLQLDKRSAQRGRLWLGQALRMVQRADLLAAVQAMRTATGTGTPARRSEANSRLYVVIYAVW